MQFIRNSLRMELQVVANRVVHDDDCCVVPFCFRLFKIKLRYRNVLDTMFELLPRMARYCLFFLSSHKDDVYQIDNESSLPGFILFQFGADPSYLLLLLCHCGDGVLCWCRLSKLLQVSWCFMKTKNRGEKSINHKQHI